MIYYRKDDRLINLSTISVIEKKDSLKIIFYSHVQGSFIIMNYDSEEERDDDFEFIWTEVKNG